MSGAEGADATPATVRLVVELTPADGNRVDGRVRFDDNRTAEFHGWMDLLGLLENAVTAHRPPAPYT
ncbi:hypothetical protein [Frankia sp. Cppng1_Ct_nod]|uniref:hypothetical protein n=1 Tax=Frankia sp. Cppng1_Ct_nod TaxID=2897162 RepID=UPI00104185FE|nr:hypothetical protein [Frankia sp. Cppng1_Ct_nod]